MDARARRRLLRRVAAVSSALRGDVPPLDFETVSSALRAVPPPLDFEHRTLPVETRGPGEVTRELLGRLLPEQREELLARLTPDQREEWNAIDDDGRGWLTLPYALHHGVSGVEERTGLRAAMPPAEVHAMSREVDATGGGLGSADLVAEALAAVGAPVEDGQRVLDFGCSSGRVVRVLAAWRPEARWLGCDPNAEAIAWARQHLPEVEFAVSPTRPPLDLEAGSLDAAFAISIWSHFEAAEGLAWLGEMHRLLRPGGHLVLTAHGMQSPVHVVATGQGTRETQRPIAHALYQDGFRFVHVFTGPEGDWGVPAEGWGMSFFTPEWLLDQVTPQWRLAWFRTGRLEGNQDVYVLERR